MIKSCRKQEHSNTPDLLPVNTLYLLRSFYDFQLRLQILPVWDQVALFLIKWGEAWWQLKTRKCSGGVDAISVMRSMVMESRNHWALFYGSSFLIRTSNKSAKQPRGRLELPGSLTMIKFLRKYLCYLNISNLVPYFKTSSKIVMDLPLSEVFLIFEFQW